MSFQRCDLWLLLAPLAGFVAMVLPELIWSPVPKYSAPLFPLLYNAVEHVGLAQLGLFIATGMLLGLLSNRKWWFLGFLAVLSFPLAAVAEMVVDPTSHNLFPIEFLFYGFYGFLIAVGVAVTQYCRHSSPHDHT